MKTRSGITLVYAGDDAQEKFEELLVLAKAGRVAEANALVEGLRLAFHKRSRTPGQETDVGSEVQGPPHKLESPHQS